jgi:hypothetical protein
LVFSNTHASVHKVEKERPIYDVEMLTVELEGLPVDADPKQIRQMYFSNEHVVKTEQQVNSITGKSNGYAKVKLRCQNGLRSDALLKSLYKKGVKFRVNTCQKATDISNKNPVYRN